MCGLTGFLDPRHKRTDADATMLARSMADRLHHRGPDAGGAWSDAAAGVALAHRRLAIVDLTREGRQPMASSCGRYILVYNGEIYNFRELRREMEEAGERFRGHSDTEVLLAAVRRWGIEDALRRSAGMFSLALWDRAERKLTLARDRMGEKPLYLARIGNALVFGSELKALRAYPGFDDTLDRGAMTLFLRHNYVPAPYAIFASAAKLLPGSYLSVTLDALSDGWDVHSLVARATPYWSARSAASQGMRTPFPGDDAEAVEQLDTLLGEVIGREMMSDVPLGAFLSGGIDSSMVAALMQKHSSRSVRTFTMGFRESGYDEAVHAKEVAAHLGTEHTEFYVSSEEARAVIPSLPTIYDEPFADSSQIPTFLVSRLARQHVTVSLSGDGGDELFGGYRRYFLAARIWERLKHLPAPVRSALAGGVRALAIQPTAIRSGPLAGLGSRLCMLTDQAEKLSQVIGARNADDLYLRLVSQWRDPAAVMVGGHEPPTPLSDGSALGLPGGLVPRMMYLDAVSYLPDDIMTKVDRAGMAVSLETRAPMLDHTVFEFAWSLPLSMKIRDGKGKWLLRQVLSRYVPERLFERPKMGFGVPLGQWLSGPLRDWAEALLAEHRIREDGLFQAAPIRAAWRQHLAGTRNWQYQIWTILMFQAWYDSLANWAPPAEDHEGTNPQARLAALG